MDKHELRKDNPMYYKTELRSLISEAQENGLENGYEISEKDGKVTCIKIVFTNDISEIADVIVYEACS